MKKFLPFLLLCFLGGWLLPTQSAMGQQCNNCTNGGTIGYNQSLCGPSADPAPLVNVATPTGGSGTIQYVWLVSDTLVPNRVGNPYWMPIAGANGPTYDPGPTTETLYYIRCARRQGCSMYRGESNIITIEILPVPTIHLAANDPTCASGIDGSITATASGSTGPYSLVWSTGATSNTISGLGTGTYSVTVTDANGCTATHSVSIMTPSCCNVTQAGTIGSNQSSCGAFDPAPIVSTQDPSGGLGALEIVWLESPNANGQPNTVIQGANGLSYDPGVITQTTYYRRCARRAGCSSYPGESNWVCVEVYPEPSISVTATDLLCFQDGSGSATATGSGGTTPYSYLWSDGQTTATATGLAAGTYTVTVTDSNGCSASGSATVNEPLAVGVNAIGTDVSCNGFTDGSATATAGGGTPPYTYLWSDGQTTATATGLATGTYSVTATDANACTATASVTIGEPMVLGVNTTATDASCNGFSDGSITANGTGGTAPYSYLWSDGQTTATATGLSAGMYTVTVTDANNCTASGGATVGEPTVVTVGVTTMDALCNGSGDGSATATAGGGTPPYTILWSDGQMGPNANNLVAGTYTVTVTDANNCTATGTAMINEPTVIVVTTTGTDATCFGFDDGEATVSATGGTPPYTFVWSDGQMGPVASNLIAGTYDVSITDANTCMSSGSVTIGQPDQVTAAIDCCQDDAIECGGSADIMISFEGQGPFTFTYSDGSQPMTVTTNENPYTLTVSPTRTTTYRLVSVTGGNNCEGTTCGAATIASECAGGLNNCYAVTFDTDTQGNALAAGTNITDQWAAWGLTISASGGIGEAWIFDSSNPTGGDPDLGSPHSDFGGPGVGSGGAQGTPGENNTALGNILIVQENANGAPDDAIGGVITFTFDRPTSVDNLTVIDVDENGSNLTVVTLSGTTVIPLQRLGDNSIEVIDVNMNDVISMTLDMVGSGGVCCLEYCLDCVNLNFATDPHGNALAAGTNITNQFAQWGVNISATGGIGEAWIFDSGNPTGGDIDLGSPNADFNGPGIGNGGGAGSAGEHNVAQGNVLIVQENNNTPDDARGGSLTFTFDAPASVNSMTMLDIDENGTDIIVNMVSGTATIQVPNLGDNSLQTVPINLDGVLSIEVDFRGSGAVSDLSFCPVECTSIDFTHDGAGNDLQAGDNITTQLLALGISNITAVGGIDEAWIFDTSNPTGGDDDLGTPNSDFGGPGLGTGGALGAPGENAYALGNVLIVQENNNTPDDNARGGDLIIDFANPVDLLTLTVLDIERSGSYVQVTRLDGSSNTIQIGALGDNSAIRVPIGESRVISMLVHFRSSGAIAGMDFCENCSELGLHSNLVSNTVTGDDRTVTVSIFCDPFCEGNSPDFVDISVPCGDIASVTSTSGTATIINNDPITGLTGIRVTGLDPCDPNSNGTDITYVLTDVGCGNSVCDPLIAYAQGNCVQYVNTPGQGPNPDLDDFVPQSLARKGAVDLTAYPNPTNGVTIVKLTCEDCGDEPAKMVVTDLYGGTLLVEDVPLYDGQGQAVVDLANQSAGLFIIRADMGKETITKKVVKQ